MKLNPKGTTGDVAALRDYIRVSLYTKGDDNFQFAFIQDRGNQSDFSKRKIVNAVLYYVVSFWRVLGAVPEKWNGDADTE